MRILLTKLFVVISLSLGRMPRLVALLDLFHTPSIARVVVTRKRKLAYTELFTVLDRDGRRAAPITRSSLSVSKPDRADLVPQKRYIPVDTA